jgi:hypothetical protein
MLAIADHYGTDAIKLTEFPARCWRFSADEFGETTESTTLRPGDYRSPGFLLSWYIFCYRGIFDEGLVAVMGCRRHWFR